MTQVLPGKLTYSWSAIMIETIVGHSLHRLDIWRHHSIEALKVQKIQKIRRLRGKEAQALWKFGVGKAVD